MSYQPPEQQLASPELPAQGALPPPDLLRMLLDLSQRARSAPAEEAFLRQAASLLLGFFQAGRVEVRLFGSLPGLVATTAPDGSITFLSLPAEMSEMAAHLLKPPEAAENAPMDAHQPLSILAALLQDEGAASGSIQLTEPRAGHFTDEQRALFPTVAQYLAMLLQDRRQHEQLTRLAVADERSRLARELHDAVVQSLVALVLRLDRIEEPQGEIAEARLLAHQALEDARRAIWGLRPALLETLPFHEALAREVERMADEGGLSSRITVIGQPRALAPQQEMALFRIAQEALSNVIRHARARRARASLAYTEDGARLVVEDDGRGFTPAALEAQPLQETAPRWLPYFDEAAPSASVGLASHFGLQTMRERARLVGGWLELESAPGQGTRIIVNLPYTAPSGLLPHAAEPPANQLQTSQPPGADKRTSVHGQRSLALRQPPAVLPAETAAPAPPAVQAGRTRILIVDDHTVTRAGIRRLLEHYADFEVVGEAADGLEALAEAQDLGPQVVLMDMRMPGMNGLEALRQLRASNPDLRVLMLSAYEQDEDVFESLKAGASGYVLKDIPPDELAQAIRIVARGETLLAPGLTGKLVERLGQLEQGEDPSRMLTAREREVLRALAAGLRNKEIARQLFVSERTVTFHLANIYQKLGVSSRTEALRRALELGLLKS
jgi:DNA-binding NarL/FixJ family response regulator/signal transduction histidine kinase